MASNDKAYGAMLIAVVALGVGFLGWALPGRTTIPASDTTPLGVWKSFPSQFSPNFCTAGNLTDRCELFYNSTQRGVVITSVFSVIQARISVACVAPSNTMGAYLQLQYANYSLATGTNSSNFANVSSQLFIDNRIGTPCPGTITTPTAGSLAYGNSYIFRVLGADGGGVGDNPRFGSIRVLVYLGVLRITYPTVATRSTTAFTVIEYTNYPTSASIVTNFQWIATNITASSCINLNVCIQKGAGTCTIAIAAASCSVSTTFGTAFSATPTVVISNTAPSALLLTMMVGQVDLMLAQTVTV